jgi:hypothetical protein
MMYQEHVTLTNVEIEQLSAAIKSVRTRCILFVTALDAVPELTSILPDVNRCHDSN